MQKRLYALAVVALLLCIISPVQAAQFLFTPAIVVSEQYTDNLFLDRQNEEEDYITATGLDLTGQLLWRTAGMELHYKPTYNTYKNNDQLNDWRQEASLRAWKEFSRSSKLELNDTYLRTNDPTDQSPVIIQNGQPQSPVIQTDRSRRGRHEYYTNVAHARMEHQFGPNDRVYAAYEYSILRDVTKTPGVPVDDNNIATPSIGLAYDFSPKWAVEIDSAYAINDYKDQNDRNEYDGNVRLLYRFDRALSSYVNYRHTILNYDQGTDEDYKIYEPSIGMRYDFKENARIEIGVGYYVQDFKTSKDKTGINATSDINKRWNYRTGYFGISGGSGYIIDDTGVEDNGLNIYYDGRIEAGYNFTSRLSGSVFCSYRHDEYPDEIPKRVKKTGSAGAELNWQALKWMAFGLSYRFSDVSSDRETDQYTENRAMLTVRIAPSTPWRLN